MKRNFGNAKHKNHVSSAAPGTLNAMHNLFGISVHDFLKACHGDHESIKKLSDLGRLSELTQTNLEPALQAAKLTIETTGDLNKALSELVKQTQKSGKQVTTAILDSQLAEKRFANELTEAKAKFANDVSAETSRHLRQSSLIQIRGYTADLMALVRYQTAITREQNKLPLAQQSAEIEYDKAVAATLWAKGSEADLSKIPKPNYKGSAYGLGKLWKGFKDTLGI
ncbi:MAG: hypothetical protein F6K14_15670 [Symploca sp. SIO2C1]|nr:hypothetical protein [Symploca sp. SIO2C1]